MKKKNMTKEKSVAVEKRIKIPDNVRAVINPIMQQREMAMQQFNEKLMICIQSAALATGMISPNDKNITVDIDTMELIIHNKEQK